MGVRSDVIRLGEALAGQLGLADGKLRERLGFDWLTDIYPNGMHDMKTLLATAGLQSPGLHTEQDAYARGRSELESHALLASAWRDLVALDFKEGRSLEDVLSTVRHAVTLRAKSGGRSQKAVARLLHISQTKVSDILRKPAPSQPDTPEAS